MEVFAGGVDVMTGVVGLHIYSYITKSNVIVFSAHAAGEIWVLRRTRLVITLAAGPSRAVLVIVFAH